LGDNWDRIKSWLKRDSNYRPISIEEADVLSSNRRRAAIKVLSNSEKDVFQLTELADEVCELEYGEEFPKQKSKSVYSTLHSTHLNNMANAKIIEFKKEPYYKVRKKSKLCELDQYIEEEPSEESLFKGLPENPEKAFTANQGFNALKNPRRRFIIGYLDEVESTSIKNLYSDLAASENSDQLENISKNDLKKFYVSLKQTHIPFLEQINTVSYDEQSGIVTGEDNLQHLSKYLPNS